MKIDKELPIRVWIDDNNVLSCASQKCADIETGGPCPNMDTCIVLKAEDIHIAEESLESE